LILLLLLLFVAEFAALAQMGGQHHCSAMDR
jgi:hypothetical protein